MDATALAKLPNTPMWAQYAEIKRNALQELLFYRMGDFYELFLEDAIEASAILGITLTARNKGEDSPIPMCGVPFHSSANYINRLLKAGKRVAICEQIEEAGQGKGIVKREIARIVSPGMAFDPDSLDSDQHNYFLSLRLNDDGQSGSFCKAELTTGEMEYSSFASLEQLTDDLALIRPKEIIATAEQIDTPSWIAMRDRLNGDFFQCVTSVPDFYFHPDTVTKDLCGHFHVLNLEGFGLHKNHSALGVVGAAFRRMRDTQKGATLAHLQAPTPMIRGEYIQIDESTLEHLDLFPKESQNPAESLFHHLNRTSTAMGARLLKEFLAKPLRNQEKILLRQSAITELKENHFLQRSIHDQLSGIRDLERLMAKVGLQTASPRDLVALKEVLVRLPLIRQTLVAAKAPYLKTIHSGIQPFAALHARLEQQLKEDAPAITREGGIFRSGWHAELDELITLTEDGKTYLQQMEQNEREKTGISSLKIKYNRVFGYFIEVTQANLSNVPSHYTRKQTMSNGERYLTEELKTFEDKILRAQEKRISLEESLFTELVAEINKETKQILGTAQNLALLDVLSSLAIAATEHNYVAPSFDQTTNLYIEEGRHPVIENLVGKNLFTKNSLHLSPDLRTLLITGPNMAGKSTYMRQIALIVLMAHMGSYVPAKAAKIGCVDRIAARIGASDRIGRGQSTFMVEMNEMSRILRQSTEQSLLIIDEIGRGTSTYDGLALAWAILEDLVGRLKCRVLFATHYHELTQLDQSLPALKNVCAAVEERDGRILFLHEIRDGKAEGSYGVEVAKLAGLPSPIVQRAESLLAQLESGNSVTVKAAKPKKSERTPSPQLGLFAESRAVEIPPQYLLNLEDGIRTLDLDQVTPFEALMKLKSLKDGLPQSPSLC